MTTRSKPVLAAVLCVPLFVLNMASQSAPARPVTAKENWDTVKALAPGTEVQIAPKGSPEVKGKVATVTDDSIRVRSGKQEQAIRREDIAWISEKVSRRKTHVATGAMRGALIGAGIGVGFGLACSAAVGGQGAICYVAVPVGAGLYAGFGAALGAVHPATTWREIYRP